MTKKLTTFDKIQRSLFADPGDRAGSLTKDEAVMRERWSRAFTFWVNNPSYSDNQIVRFLVNECGIRQRQAYNDLLNIKRLLGNIREVSREWLRYTVIEMAKEAYRLAKLNKDPKGMILAADKIGKYSRLDKTEQDDIPWDQIVPPNFEPSPDISVLGFKPDPNIEEKRRRLREKYLRQYDPTAITDAEIVE